MGRMGRTIGTTASQATRTAQSSDATITQAHLYDVLHWSLLILCASLGPCTSQDMQLFSVEITATYTTSGLNNNWHDDLKKALRHAGEKRKPAVFMFSDSQVSLRSIHFLCSICVLFSDFQSE